MTACADLIFWILFIAEMQNQCAATWSCCMGGVHPCGRVGPPAAGRSCSPHWPGVASPIICRAALALEATPARLGLVSGHRWCVGVRWPSKRPVPLNLLLVKGGARAHVRLGVRSGVVVP